MILHTRLCRVALSQQVAGVYTPSKLIYNSDPTYGYQKVITCLLLLRCDEERTQYEALAALHTIYTAQTILMRNTSEVGTTG